jgi:integrase
VIAKLYEVTSGLQVIYPASFEFSFYTRMRPRQPMALCLSQVDLRKKTANRCRIQLYGKIKERTRNKGTQEVLLNDRAPHALEKPDP